jgi:hypothetical protein
VVYFLTGIVSISRKGMDGLTKALMTKVGLPIDHPDFFSRLFSIMAKQHWSQPSPKDNKFKRACIEQYVGLSERASRAQIQEGCSIRNILRARRFAFLLITDNGELDFEALHQLKQCFKGTMYSIGPDRVADIVRQEHILRVLDILENSKEAVRLLKSISKPVSHRYAEQIIRSTLQMPQNAPLTDAHARRAALSAWFAYLRQSVGSCFATAPAIIIHNEQPELFLKDINELLNTGRLKRTFGGIEYTAPLSSSWGSGDLRKRFVLTRDIEQSKVEIWQSPGFISALVAVEIIEKRIPLNRKTIMAKKLVGEILKNWSDPGFECVVTAEQLLKAILLDHYKINERDVQEYLSRPIGMIHSSLLMQVSKGGGTAGKGAACAQYIQQMEVAKDAFKAFADNALLKAWEFTLASFCDVKSDFSRWNLYSSLGLAPEDKGGIGNCLYEAIKQKLDHYNAKVAEYQIQYEQVFTQVKMVESRLKNASTEKEVHWLRAEYQSRLQEFHLLEELRDKAHKRAHTWAGAFSKLIELYTALFPRFFQEVYDAEMHDVPTGGQYDDSPAGFRLLFKHGRENTSLWTRIYTPNEFIQSLTSFFISTEREITADPFLQILGEDLSDIITRVVNLVRTNEFLETAFHRMAIYHRAPIIKDPLNHIDRIEKKPWAYTSGGTMDTLLSCYYKREQKPSETTRWVESCMELLVFYLDTLRQIPPKMTEPYLLSPYKSLITHSPTHAFLLKPGYTKMRDGWTTEAYTYVWARDHLVQPMEQMVSSFNVDELAMRAILEMLVEKIPNEFKQLFLKAFHQLPASLSSSEFRQHIVDTLNLEPTLHIVADRYLYPEDVDSVLYSTLPWFSQNELKSRIDKVIEVLPNIAEEDRFKIRELYETYSSEYSIAPIISAKHLRDIVKSLISLAKGTTLMAYDFQLLINQAMQKLGYSMPAPIIFADTNWVKDLFGFVLSPGSNQLELWRVNSVGDEGYPMWMWKPWVDGSRTDPPWGVYSRPVEYLQ